MKVKHNISKTKANISVKEKREGKIVVLSISKHHLENIFIKFFLQYDKKQSPIGWLLLSVSMLVIFCLTERFITISYLNGHNDFFFRLVILLIAAVAFFISIYQFVTNSRTKCFTKEQLLDDVTQACDNYSEADSDETDQQ